MRGHPPRFRIRFPGTIAATLMIVSGICAAQAVCTDHDDFAAVAAGQLGAGDAFNTLYELAQCTASSGVQGANPPLEFIDPATPSLGYALTSGQPGDTLAFRFVPLCADGSGDHAYTTSDPANPSGIAPSCEPADYIRCGDGTRPIYYADKAVEFDGYGEPSDLDADNWVFYLEGGANCSDEVHRGDDLVPPRNLDIDQGEMCTFQYQRDRPMMSSDGAPQSRDLGGIMSANQLNEFSAFNRVVIDRCTQDLWIGDRDPFATWTNSDNSGNPVANSRSYTLFRHGHRIIKAVFADLASGPEFTGINGNDAFVMPALANAEDVLLTGNSNGAFGLMHTGDSLAAEIHSISEPAINIRLVFDNRWKPGIESEISFNTPAACALGACSMYDHVCSGRSSHVGNYTNRQYLPHSAPGVNDGKIRAQLDSWGGNLDASCRAHHLVLGDEWRCYDLAHVVANHVSTPFFVHTSLKDSALRTHPVDWSSDPINHAWTPTTFRERMLVQLEDLFFLRPTQTDEGLDNTTWSMAVFAPDSTQHVAIVDNAEFFDVCLEDSLAGVQYTYATALHDWLLDDDPAQGMPVAIGLVEGGVGLPAVPCP